MAIDPQELTDVGVIAVIRAPSPDLALRATDSIVEGGVRGIEITYSTPDPTTVIATLRDRYGDSILLGAGTITAPSQAAEAADAGAQFLVSPGTSARLAAAMSATGRTTMLGAITPTEVMGAVEAGADVVKIFPAGLHGPRLLSSLRGPFPSVPFMPTGGVHQGNVAEWVRAGVVAVGVGGELISSADFDKGDFAEVEDRARALVAAYGVAREELAE